MIRGILAVWSDITPEAAADYDAWYEQSHMFERLAVEGIHRARHYRTVAGAQQHFTYFMADTARVFKSPAYLESANNASPWTQRILPHFRNTNRTAFNVVQRTGWGYGASAMTLRLAAETGRETELLDWLGQSLFPELLQQPGIIGAQIWKADMEATLVAVQDSQLRQEADQTSPLAIFIEGTGSCAIQSVSENLLTLAELITHGAADGAIMSLHQLMNSAEKEPMLDI
jgi:hypothetical protein